MSFSSPWWLLLLLLVPLVIVLHALSIRWRSTPASSLVFWNEVLKERKASLRIRRLLTSLVLLLQVLAMTALAVALGGPLIAGLSQERLTGRDPRAGRHGQHAGARGRADPVGHRARARARPCGRPPRRGAHGGGARGEVAPAAFAVHRGQGALCAALIQSARPTDEPGDVASSVLFAMSLRDPRRGGRVVLETDGAFDELPGVDTSLPWVRVDVVGRRGTTWASRRCRSAWHRGPERATSSSWR